MVTKHFFKTVILFSGMIILGLIGVFLVNHFDQESGQVDAEDSKVKVAN